MKTPLMQLPFGIFQPNLTTGVTSSLGWPHAQLIHELIVWSVGLTKLPWAILSTLAESNTNIYQSNIWVSPSLFSQSRPTLEVFYSLAAGEFRLCIYRTYIL